jgi:hypothetical protein
MGFEQSISVIENAIRIAESKKIVMLAAASNSGGNSGIAWPARSDHFICVYATDSFGNRCEFTPTENPHSDNFAFLGKQNFRTRRLYPFNDRLWPIRASRKVQLASSPGPRRRGAEIRHIHRNTNRSLDWGHRARIHQVILIATRPTSSGRRRSDIQQVADHGRDEDCLSTYGGKEGRIRLRCAVEVSRCSSARADERYDLRHHSAGPADTDLMMPYVCTSLFGNVSVPQDVLSMFRAGALVT